MRVVKVLFFFTEARFENCFNYKNLYQGFDTTSLPRLIFPESADVKDKIYIPAVNFLRSIRSSSFCVAKVLKS